MTEFDDFNSEVEEEENLMDSFGDNGPKKEDYPPPSDDETFCYYWDIFIMDIVSRDNFIKGHLELLKILCEILKDCEELTASIAVEGYVFESEGRNGTQIKNRPEVTQLAKSRTDALSYAKFLGLGLDKGKGGGLASAEGAEWN